MLRKDDLCVAIRRRHTSLWSPCYHWLNPTLVETQVAAPRYYEPSYYRQVPHASSTLSHLTAISRFQERKVIMQAILTGLKADNIEVLNSWYLFTQISLSLFDRSKKYPQ